MLQRGAGSVCDFHNPLDRCFLLHNDDSQTFIDIVDTTGTGAG